MTSLHLNYLVSHDSWNNISENAGKITPELTEARTLALSQRNEGLPEVLGNKGTLAKYRREQGNISQFLGTGEQNSKNYSTKTFWESVGTWEHRAILEGNKGTGPHWETLRNQWRKGLPRSFSYITKIFKLPFGYPSTLFFYPSGGRLYNRAEIQSAKKKKRE